MGKSNKSKLILAGITLCLVFMSVSLSPSSSNASAVFGDVIYKDTFGDVTDSTTRVYSKEEISKISLIPGGFPFGVKFYTKGVIVVGLSEIETAEGFIAPATLAGFKKGDIITAINGSEIENIEDVSKAIGLSNGSEINFTVTRDITQENLILIPKKAISDGFYKSGMWIRDSTAGIGTVTFIDRDTLAFGGLGHGICDSDTGTLMPLLKGTVVEVKTTDIIRGIEGRPGEIKGEFSTDKIGTLTQNSNSGVFGVMDFVPKKVAYEPMPVASKDEVRIGKAYIYSSIFEGENKIYEIQIVKINNEKNDVKNFVIKVTDPELIKLTGGIIQGMSGSPIIQNNKIIGAITHVLINDPTKGYGIFIENMLKSIP